MTTEINYKRILNDLTESVAARKLNLREGTGRVLAGLGVGGGPSIAGPSASEADGTTGLGSITDELSGQWNPVGYRASGGSRGPDAGAPPPPPSPAPFPTPDDSVSPLILDLDGNGVKAGSLAFFDHGGDGFYELSRWVSEGDGMLVWDRNGDGVINDGSELFGGNTVLTNGEKAENGFAALADLDSDYNGIIDDRDADFSNLRILLWGPPNSGDDDGAGAFRLVTLAQVAVSSLDTDYWRADYTSDYGNEPRQIGHFTRVGGRRAVMAGVRLDTHMGETLYDTAAIPTHSESIAALPDIAGGGRIYNLRDAMALDAIGELHSPFYANTRTEERTLEQLVSAFAGADMAGDQLGREALAEKIILRWAGAEGAAMQDYSDGGFEFGSGEDITPEQAAVVEAFMGHQWRSGEDNRNPGYADAGVFKTNYQWHYERLYANLMLHTHLNDLWDAVTFSVKEGAEDGSSDVADYTVNLSGVKAILDGENNSRLVEFLRTMTGIYGSADFWLDAVRAADSQWVDGLYALADSRGEIIHGSFGNENLHGLSGREHRDMFDANGRNNNTLYGYGGDDVYWFGRGTGHDRIDERRGNASGDAGDEIWMKSDIEVSDVRWRRVGNNLHVQIVEEDGELSDSLEVLGHFSHAASRVENLVFADGTEWDLVEFVDRIIGTSANEDLYSSVGGHRDVFDSHGGGNDVLHGFGGNDVYWLGVGTGHDRIEEQFVNPSGDDGDEIRIKSYLGVSDVRWRRIGDSMHIQIVGVDGEVSDSLEIVGHYSSVAARVEKVVFADGTEWDLSVLSADRIVGTAANENLYGLRGREHRDVFDSSGGGNDTLRGYGGDDVYWLGRDTDNDTIEERYENLSGDDGDEIRIKSDIEISDVRLRRIGNSLQVQIVGRNDEVSDSLTVKGYFEHAASRVEKVVFADGTEWGLDVLGMARIVGGSGDDNLYGLGNGVRDIFDSHGGGDDTLYGYGGNDVYWLGRGTGNDMINESELNPSGDDGDEIRIKAGIEVSDVRWRRVGDNMYVEIVGEGGEVSDSLEILGHFSHAAARVEKVVFADGTEWDLEAFVDRIVGGSGNEELYGFAGLRDIFDSNGGGNDTLYGYSGNDVYWLGYGTGHDTIDERRSNASGDDGDEMRIKSGIEVSDVRLHRSGNNLHVQVERRHIGILDSLEVLGYFEHAASRVEKVVFADGTEWGLEELDMARIVGTSKSEDLYGLEGREYRDIFDSHGGGNDTLIGYGGDDVYWLGYGTGHDTIDERRSNASGDDGDEIRIKSGIAVSAVRLRRSGNNLQVQVIRRHVGILDSLEVLGYFEHAASRVEKVVFADGTEWGLEELDMARIIGGSGNEDLYGLEGREYRDIFDSHGGGNDTLYGYGGDDVYWLGYGTGHDTIDELENNASGDDGDEIRIKADIALSAVRLRRVGNDLQVQIERRHVGVLDSLEVLGYFEHAAARVEKVVFADGTEWGLEELDMARIVGGSGNEDLYGLRGRRDIFDSHGGGNDTLHGYSGNDVYWLGHGTGHDTINELSLNPFGDEGDEIRIKAGIALSEVRLRRVGNDLQVQIERRHVGVLDSLEVLSYFEHAAARVEKVVFADGTEWGLEEFDMARIVGTSKGEDLYGLDGREHRDIFDSDGGGNDTLYGYGGNDVYWLGRGTGHDMIDERYLNASGDDGDEIRIKAGIALSEVRLRRVGNDLQVQIERRHVGVLDSLEVLGHFEHAAARVEKVVFADGTEWGLEVLDMARIVGGSGDDTLYGLSDRRDIFDSHGGGNDTLIGYSGNDVYWLGRGTGHDTIDERRSNPFGDDGDEIRIKEDIALSAVRLRQVRGDLHVQIVRSGRVSDSLVVQNQFWFDASRVESIHAGGKVLLEHQYYALIQEMAAFSRGDSEFADADAIRDHYWRDDVALMEGS